MKPAKRMNDDRVKKIVLIPLVLFCFLGLLSASPTGLAVGMGIPSDIGLEYSAGRFDSGIRLSTSMGLGGLLSYSFMDKMMDSGLSGWDRFAYGNNLIHGLSIDAYYRILDSKACYLSLGGSVSAYHVASREGIISHFTKGDMVLFSLSTKLGFSPGIYLQTGFPLLGYFYYGGDSNNYSCSPFDFWAFVPVAIRDAEEGGWIDVTADKFVLLFLMLDLRIGYVYRF